MNSELISILECYQSDIELLKIAFNTEIELDLESELRRALIDYRKGFNYFSIRIGILIN